MADLATFRIPDIKNEPNKLYEKDSIDRQKLVAALKALRQKAPLDIPIVVAGKETRTQEISNQPIPSSHKDTLAAWSNASTSDVSTAIEAALAAKPAWESLGFADRASIFLKAADLVSGKYRYEINAATMLGQGKNATQAEIDAAAETCDFLRFGVQYAQDTYKHQPVHNSPGVWNRVEYRPLEGFVYAITPFNFTAIAANLPFAPALMGNVVIWKPSPSAMASNWLLYNVFLEAGLPPNVIQFVPGDPVEVTKTVLEHPQFAALHYTGSTAVFRSLYGEIGRGTAEGRYKGYPRIVGETGGKNYHLVHQSADVENVVFNTVRGAFEYQGQKCSATSRAYFPKSLWDQIRPRLIEETEKLKVGGPEEFDNFVGPVIHQRSFDKLKNVIDEAKNDSELELLVGGKYDGQEGFFLPFILKALSLALQQHPLLNSSLNASDPKKPELTYRGSHNFGVAIDAPSGLLVPVVKNVQDLTITEIASKLRELSEKARSNKLAPGDFSGATFTVSNIGSVGGGVVAPVISEPQVAILGIGRSKIVPAFDENDELVKKEELILNWSADHRVVDGAECARCAERVKSYLEDPGSMVVGLR